MAVGEHVERGVVVVVFFADGAEFGFFADLGCRIILGQGYFPIFLHIPNVKFPFVPDCAFIIEPRPGTIAGDDFLVVGRWGGGLGVNASGGQT